MASTPLSRGQGTGIKIPAFVQPNEPATSKLPTPQRATEEVESKTEIFSNTPSFDDQYSRYPNTTKLGYEEFDLFKVSIPEERQRFIEFNKQRCPLGAPAILIKKETEYFSPTDGTVTITVRFKRLTYAKLVGRPRA